jgi:hypothetical protein
MNSTMSLDKLTEKFLKSKQCFNLVPLGSSASLPVPIKIDNNIYLSYLFYTGKKVKGHSWINIYGPHTLMYLSYPNIEFQTSVPIDSPNKANVKIRNEPIGIFPHEAIETLTLNEYRKKKCDLIKDFEKAIKLCFDDIPDEKFKIYFKENFYELCEPALIPSLQRIGPKFFGWLD